MSRASAWVAYMRARNCHLAAHERFVDRTQAATSIEPAQLSSQDLDEWLGLLREDEAAVRAHREALERYRYERSSVG